MYVSDLFSSVTLNDVLAAFFLECLDANHLSDFYLNCCALLTKRSLQWYEICDLQLLKKVLNLQEV
jgi:hypothetical protein